MQHGNQRTDRFAKALNVKFIYQNS